MCCCCGKEKRIINDYLGAIKKKENDSSFLKESTETGEISPQCSETERPKTTSTNDDKREKKEVYEDRLNHYEKLYRCYIDSRRVRLTRWIIIAVAAVMIATIFCCAFGPNFKSQETVNTSSNNTMVVSGYLDRGSYGYTYLRESNNGK